jgi:hypothetical protein
MSDDEPSPEVAARAASILGWTPRAWRRVEGGYTPAARFVGTAGPERCFLKVATEPTTAAMLRQEARAYRTLSGAFMPRFLGWEDHATAPLLLIEDLSHAAWPPPWTGGQVDLVLEQIAAVHAQTADLPSFSAVNGRTEGGWSTVAVDPAPFLSLGLTSPAWLAKALPVLVEAEAACSTDGSTLAHFDLRSDNICLTDTGAKFIDWSAACLGDPDLDLGAWLPSLELEGGPPPEVILPSSPTVAAWVSGYFAARAGLPIIPHAPRVRGAQLAQLRPALAWAIRALALEDG